MFPFVIPGLATPVEGSVLDVSWLNDRPAGGGGYVGIHAGHFVDGRGKRLRFLATNFTFGSSFPEHDQADKLAARLASLGINCIRFHHADNQVAPRGIWKAGPAKKDELDPGQLDRLDYFIAALKRNGIYADLNLHVSRNYWEGEDFPDGLPGNRERQEQLPNYGKGLDKINDQMVRMQRDYARALLTHSNAYTKTTYAKEPAVAIVEINNENTLLQLNVAALPEYYRQEIAGKWNQWLKAQYGTSEKLVAAWGGREELGANLLPPRTVSEGEQYFSVHSESNDTIRISLVKLPEVGWHAQFQWAGLTLEEGRLYTLEFSARSDRPRRIPVSTRLMKPDWHNCGLADEAELRPEWQDFSYVFRAQRVAPGAVRCDFVIGDGPPGDFWIKHATLRSGGSFGLKPGESLEAGQVAFPQRPQGSPRGLAWTRFLAETERAYSEGLRRFLKRELGVGAAIIDTQASYGGIAGTYRESFSDFVDMHAYWQHPHFPGRPWDGANWTIANTPMVADQNGGNLARLGIYRVAGKPFTVTEYDHPAPNQYAAEMFPMIASFAALQDWDGLFQFDWGGTDPEARRITGYFALQQHPAKLAFLPIAALMFRRGDVAALAATAHLILPEKQVEVLTADNVSMSDAWKQAGLKTSDILNHRLELGFGPGDKPALTMAKAETSPVTWDTAAELYIVDAPAVKEVVGRCAGRNTKLDGAEFEVNPNARGFAVLALSAVDGRALSHSHHLLLVAAGDAANSGMIWNEQHTSVGTKWGGAPTVCEGIGVRVTLELNAKTVRVDALAGDGARLAEVPATVSGGRVSFEIGPQFKTLCYEIRME